MMGLNEIMINVIRKNSKNFSKYLIIGIIWTVIYIYVIGVVIDKVGIPTLLGSTISISLVFLGKFFTYTSVNLMKGGFKNFTKYAYVDLVSIFLNIVLVTFAIDFLNIPTRISATIVVIMLFIGRFFIFRMINLIK